MKHTRMTSLTSFLRGCYLPSLFRPILPSVGDLPSPLMAISLYRRGLAMLNVIATFVFI